LEDTNLTLKNDRKLYRNEIGTLNEQVELYKDYAYNVKEKDVVEDMTDFTLPNFQINK
jgi:hypothetical protein